MRADETLMMRLLINLISNGITYGREGGHIEVGLSSGETGIRGYVKDDGIGIARIAWTMCGNASIRWILPAQPKRDGAQAWGFPWLNGSSPPTGAPSVQRAL